MFNVPLLHLKVHDWESKKKKLLHLMETQSSNFENQIHLHTTFYSSIRDENSDEMNNLNRSVHEILNEEIYYFMETFKVEMCKISSSWFQIQEKYMSHPVHNHYSGFAAVCYLEYNPELHTPVRFIAPFTDLFDGSMVEYNPENVTEGSILFFPSALLHHTLPNRSDVRRVALAFNLIQAESK